MSGRFFFTQHEISSIPQSVNLHYDSILLFVSVFAHIFMSVVAQFCGNFKHY